VAFPTILEKYGSLSATGLAKEATFGTPVAATTFQPMTGNTMEEDPGWFAPHLMENLRDLQVYNLYGEAHYNGALDGPLFPSNAMALMVAAIGADSAVGYGVTGTIATPTSTTVASPSIVGATTITLTSGTGFLAGQQITVDSGALLETRRIASVATNVITVSDPFAYAHAGAVAAVTGTTTTMTSPSIVTATTINVTSTAGMTQGTTIIQIDSSSPSGLQTSEVRKITTIASLVLTLDSPLLFAHASGTVVTIVTTPFTHTINQANTLPSLTVEKNLGGFQSLQFAGCKVNKFDLKAPVGNSEVAVTADMMGQSVLTMNTPTPVTVVPELPFVFAEANLTMFGSARSDCGNVTVSIENGLKETYTYSGQHGPSFITPVTLHVSGSIDVVWSSFTDATYGDFNRAHNGTLGVLYFSLVHPASGGTISITLPQIVLNKFVANVKMEDVVMGTLSFEASRPLTGAQQFTLQASVVNSVYLPY
jgi:hypothetical protein